MATTFNLELNNKPSSKGTFSIQLRITQDRKLKRIKTSIEIKRKSDFNKKAKNENWIRPSETNHAIWNEILKNEIEHAKNTYRELKAVGQATKELIKATIIESEISSSFLHYAMQRTKDIMNEGRYRNYKKYNGFCNKLIAFLHSNNKKDLLFSEVTTAYLSRFKAYLHSLKNERNTEMKLSIGTINLQFTIFQSIINRAIEIDKIIKHDNNPFIGFSFDKEKPTFKEKLNESEIIRIEELVLPEGSLIWNCRNYFLFSFYMAGIRAGDLIQLRWCNITSEDRLEYQMDKFGKTRNIKLHQKAKSILQCYSKANKLSTDYVFPILDHDATYAKAVTKTQKATMNNELMKKLYTSIESKNALINKELKKIAKLAEIEKNISFHIARHSFAKIAKDNNVDNNHLKNILGHSNIGITERYMGSFETVETDNVMDSIFEKKNNSDAKMKLLLQNMTTDEIKNLLKQFNK